MKNSVMFAALCVSAVLLCSASLGESSNHNDWLSVLLNHRFRLHPTGNGHQRVSGGSAQTDSLYDFQVQLTDAVTGQHLCGAVMIDQNWALTAAHCINGRTASSVTIPVTSRFAGTTYTSGMRQIGSVVVHPNYSPTTLTNNVALVQVKATVTLDHHRQQQRSPGPLLPVSQPSRAITPVRLPESGQLFTDSFTLVGWGSISPAVPREESTRRVVTLPTAALARCRSLYAQNLITEGMLCAGQSYTGMGLCQGDAGAGLTQFDQTLNAEVLVGIGSFGFDCGHGKFPSVFTAVSNYVSWIQETVSSTANKA